MPASLRFLAADDATVLSSDNHGNVLTPGTSTPLKRFLENYGDADADETTLTITQVGNNDGSTYAQLAPDSGGSPGAWTTLPLSFGTLIPSATTPFWVRESVPAGRTADRNVRRYDLIASGLSN